MADTELLVRIAAQDSASRSVQRMQSSIIRLVGAVASLAAVFKTVTFPAQQAIEFERALRDVQKTTDFADSTINSLGNSLRELSAVTGVAAVDLADIAAKAGQLGLGRQGQAAILAFTETVSRFAVVADLSVDEAATSIAKIANIFQIPIDQSERVASAFNELSNTTTATADQLIDVVRRVGDASGLLDFEQSLGLAAQALELGQTPEVAGTAIIKTFSNAQVKAEEFANVLGITTEQWARQVQVDGVGAIQSVARAISQLSTLEQGVLIKELFGGGRQFAFGAKLVADAGNNFAILGRTLDSANKAFREATSAQLEYERISNSTARQTEVLGARFNNLAITFGDILQPVIREIVESLQEFLADEAVEGRVIAFAEAVADAIDSIADFVGEIAASEDAFSNLFDLLKLFVGLGIAAAVGGIATAFVRLSARIILAARSAGTFLATISSFSSAAAAVRQSLTSTASASAQATAAAAAAATTATQRLTRAQQQGQTVLARYNQLLQERAALRRQAITDGVRQARAQNQSLQAQLNRVQRVGQAFDQGFAQRGVIQTRLREINTALPLVGQNLNTIGQRAAASTGIFQRLSGVLFRLGATALRLVTGPLGILALFFADDIIDVVRDFFGFMSDEVTEGTARTRAEIERSARTVRESIGAFEEGLTRTGRTAVVDVEFRDGDINGFTQRVGEGVSAFFSLQRQAAGAAAEYANLVSRTNTFNNAVEQNVRTIGQLEERLNLISATSLFDSTAQEQVAEIRQTIQTLTTENERLLQAAVDTSLTILSVQREQDSIGTRLVQQGAELGKFLNDDDLTGLVFARGIGVATQQVQKLEKELANLRQEEDKLKSGSQEQLDVAVQIVDVQTKLRQTRDSLGGLENGFKSTGTRIDKTFKTLIDQVQAFNEDGLRVTNEQFNDLIDNIARNNAGAEGSANALVTAFKEAAATAVVFGAQSDVFTQLTLKIDATKDAVQGIFDNLDTAARASRFRIAELVDEFNSVPRKIETQIQVTRDQDRGAVGFNERLIERLNERLAEQEQLGRTLEGQAGRIARGRAAELRTRIEAAKVERDNLAVEQEKGELIRNFTTEVRRLETQQENLRKITEKINALGPLGPKPTVDEIKARELLNQEYLITNNRLQDQQRAAEDAFGALSRFRGVVEGDTFSPGAFQQSAISVEETSKFGALLESSAAATRDATADATIAARDMAVANSNAAKSMAALQTAGAEALENFKELGKEIGLTPAALDLMIQRIQVAAREFENTAEAAKRVQEIRTSFDGLNLVSLPETEELRTEATALAGVIGSIVEDALLAAVRDGLITGEQASRQFGLDLDQDKIVSDIRNSLENADPFGIDVVANIAEVTGNANFTIEARNNAAGGYIQGPGTGTSDSILSWLSNGEYVMDAMTTRVFGPGFFRGLQKAARSGNPFRIPRFASGGFVGQAGGFDGMERMLELASRSPGTRDQVDVNFNMNGDSIRLTGDREEVQRLQRLLRGSSRGRTR